MKERNQKSTLEPVGSIGQTDIILEYLLDV